MEILVEHSGERCLNESRLEAIKEVVMSSGMKRHISGICLVMGAFIWMAGAANAQKVVVDAAPSHAVNSFSPFHALGAAIDRLRTGTRTSC